MPIANVDRATFTALTLAQAAITYARKAMPYGSANQENDLLRQRNGDPAGAQGIARLNYNRAAVDAMLMMPHAPLPASFGATPETQLFTYFTALSAGISLYYGAGNCDEHARVTYHFLTTFGFPGLRIVYATSTVMGHAYTVISWQGCKDWVVCDAWPTQPQACRWSEFFGNATHSQTQPAFNVRIVHDITNDNMGTDLIGDAYKCLSPAFVQSLRLGSSAPRYTQQQVAEIIKKASEGSIYNHKSVLNDASQPWMDYRYTDEKNVSQLLSKTALQGEQWTARLAKVILEVNNEIKVLDPAKRYTAARAVV